MTEINKISINGQEHIIVDSALTQNFNAVVVPDLSGDTVQEAIDDTVDEKLENYYTQEEVNDIIDGIDVSEQLLAYPDSAVYDSESKQIKFSHNGTDLSGMTINAAAFIKDGMVDKVEVKDGNLEITFNVDADEEVIKVAISDIFNASNYLTKAEVEEALAKKADTATTYTKEDVDKDFLKKTDAADTYLTIEDAEETYLTKEEAEGTYATKTEVEDAVEGLASEEYVDEALEDYYTKGQVDTKLEGYYTSDEVDAELDKKADKDNTYTKTEVNDKLSAITDTIEGVVNVLDEENLNGYTVQGAIEKTIKENVEVKVEGNTLVINVFKENV